MANVFPELDDSISQANWRALIRATFGENGLRISGMGLSAGTGLNAEVGTGFAITQYGTVIEFTTAQTIAVTASSTNYIYLNASTGALVKSTSEYNPSSDYLPLGRVITDGTTVISCKGFKGGQKKTPGMHYAQITIGQNQDNSSWETLTDFYLPSVRSGELWYFIACFRVARDQTAGRFAAQMSFTGQYCLQSNIMTVATDAVAQAKLHVYSYAGLGMAYHSTDQDNFGATANMAAFNWNVIGRDSEQTVASTANNLQIKNLVASASVTMKAGSFIVGWRIA